MPGECSRYPRPLVAAEIRRVLEQARAEILAGQSSGASIEARAAQALAGLERPSLRLVFYATGVVLNTNLGRAPLGKVESLPGYSNLEYDLATGRRGKRDVHISRLLERLLDAPGIAVNNNAAAVFLALNELAGGGEAIVSRGELIEIGDGFRIPEIMARSGAVLREVGTTNRTEIADYRAAITERTRLLMRVHPSNFRMSGFTARPALDELAALGREFDLTAHMKTLAAAASRTCARSASTSRWCPKASRPAPIWCPSAATNCWAVRKRASWRGKRKPWRACGAIHCFER